MARTKQQLIDELQYKLTSAIQDKLRAETTIKNYRESVENRKLVVAETMAKAIAQSSEAMSKLVLSINGQL